MLSKIRTTLALAVVAMLAAESNAVKLGHEIQESADAMAAEAGITEDCADGNCEVTEGNTEVSIMGAEDGEVAVAVDGGDDNKDADDDCCCGGNSVDIDITMEFNGASGEAAAEEGATAEAESGAAESGESSSTTTTTTTTTTSSESSESSSSEMTSEGENTEASGEESAMVTVVDQIAEGAENASN